MPPRSSSCAVPVTHTPHPPHATLPPPVPPPVAHTPPPSPSCAIPATHTPATASHPQPRPLPCLVAHTPPPSPSHAFPVTHIPPPPLATHPRPFPPLLTHMPPTRPPPPLATSPRPAPPPVTLTRPLSPIRTVRATHTTPTASRHTDPLFRLATTRDPYRTFPPSIPSVSPPLVTHTDPRTRLATQPRPALPFVTHMPCGIPAPSLSPIATPPTIFTHGARMLAVPTQFPSPCVCERVADWECEGKPEEAVPAKEPLVARRVSGLE
ncbi:hypothetical protein K439DRAFT_879742 [Ramaria rubella]|nr:hypothetical protein K439DRAFT_879742 [Ramaria rubella]